MVQKHLSYEEMTNLGCFYTPEKFVDKLIELVKSNITNYNQYVFADTSCGYGAFLSKLTDCQTIGCDIDEKALTIAHNLNPYSIYYNKNTLNNFKKENMGLSENSKLIIIGNPPYNDTTSKIKNNIKNSTPCLIDDDLKTRDLGISFMLSYNKLRADYVAILHPLSYMIKKANYKLLEPFYQNYDLIDHVIINSQEFSKTSKTSGFPIIIALYKRDKNGLPYKQILNKTFKTIEKKYFSIAKNSISNYISKYPSKHKTANEKDILFFTMRDINALKRSKTFINEYSDNAIIIDKNKFAYYCYVDIFKEYIDQIPYYLGNCDVFIDDELFQQYKDIFVCKAIQKHSFLKDKISIPNYDCNNFKLIDEYFKMLFRETI